MSYGFTLDTGALIALERRKSRAVGAMRDALEGGCVVTVPAVALAEWWRGYAEVRRHVLEGVVVEPMSEELAMIAGEALAHVRGATTIDAIVMASAAQRGDIVLTGDVDDLTALHGYFRAVDRVLRA